MRTRIIRESKAPDPEAADLKRLRDEWTAARRNMQTEVVSGVCWISGCNTMPFVTLKTAGGPLPICLRHFEKLKVEAA